ncbi:MAG: PfkB family carbohydrate kinase [Candidatus Bathyarchaeia archaeon]
MVQSIFCVGNLAKQEFIVNGESQIFLSGSAAYTALAAKTINVNVTLISSIGKDFPQVWLKTLINKGIKLKIKKVKSKPSIFFRSLNNKLIGRNIKVHAKNLPLLLKNTLKIDNPDLIYIAPNNLEIQKKLLNIANLTNSIIGLGIHEYDLKRVRVKDVLNLINHVNFFFLNELEAKLLTKKNSLLNAIKILECYSINKVIVVTIGAKGTILIYNGKVVHVPAFQVEAEIDPIGAGDSFAGAFLAKYLVCRDFIEACKYGCLISSLVVTDFGLNALLKLTQKEVKI